MLLAQGAFQQILDDRFLYLLRRRYGGEREGNGGWGKGAKRASKPRRLALYEGARLIRSRILVKGCGRSWPPQGSFHKRFGAQPTLLGINERPHIIMIRGSLGVLSRALGVFSGSSWGLLGCS